MLSSRPVQFNDSSIVKTPGRTLIKGRANLQENAARHTVNPKARHTHTVNGKAGGQKTPFHPATLQPQRLFGKDKHAVAARPLIDKTPFPNRTHPAPAHPPTGKKSGALLELRPSSTRKHIRTPRPSLQTPAVSGNPWDVSDISITTNTIAAESDSAINEEDHDALEYMPPTAVDVPYDPGFEMPEYAVLGRALWAGACTWPVDDELRVWPVDDEPRVWDGKEEGEGEEGVGWVDVGLVDVGLVLPELDDDSPFPRAKSAKPVPVPVPAFHGRTQSVAGAARTQSVAVHGRTQSVTGAARTQSVAGAARTTALSRPQSAVTRPQSASTRPQSAAARPPSVVARPQPATTRPPSASTRPQSVAARPQSAAARPQSAATRSQPPATHARAQSIAGAESSAVRSRSVIMRPATGTQPATSRTGSQPATARTAHPPAERAPLPCTMPGASGASRPGTSLASKPTGRAAPTSSRTTTTRAPLNTRTTPPVVQTARRTNGTNGTGAVNGTTGVMRRSNSVAGAASTPYTRTAAKSDEDALLLSLGGGGGGELEEDFRFDI